MLYEPDHEQSRSPTCIWNILFFRTGSRTFPITNFHLDDCIETFFFLQFRDKVHRTLHTQFEC